MATPTHPTISAVIPVHNGEEFVAEAVESVLAQTVPVVECIVVDDGSTDATRSIVAKFGSHVKYMRQDQAGVSVARNRGAEQASGAVVAFLDHDDVWVETKLERQMHAFDDPEVAMSICALQVIDADGRARDEVYRLEPREAVVTAMLLFQGTPAPSCSSGGVFRRDRLLRLGGFDPQLSMSADWDLTLRMRMEARVAYVDEPLVRYRVHGSNMSRRVGRMESDMRRAFAKAFARPDLPVDLHGRESEAYGRLYRMLAGSYRDAGQRGEALRAFALAVRHHPRLAFELANSRRYRSR